MGYGRVFFAREAEALPVVNLVAAQDLRCPQVEVGGSPVGDSTYEPTTPKVKKKINERKSSRKSGEGSESGSDSRSEEEDS